MNFHVDVLGIFILKINCQQEDNIELKKNAQRINWALILEKVIKGILSVDLLSIYEINLHF